MSGETVNVESLGRFESDADRDLFLFETAWKNLTDAHSDINYVHSYCEAIEPRFLSEPILPTVEQVTDLLAYFVDNKRIYGNMINQMLEDLGFMNLDDAEAIISSLLVDGEVDEDALQALLNDSDKSQNLLLAILTLQYTGSKEVFKVIAACVKAKYGEIGKYLTIGGDLMSGNTQSLVKNILQEIFGPEVELPSELAESVMWDSATKVAVFVALGYSIIENGYDVYEYMQMNNFSWEEVAWNFGDAVIATGASFLSAFLGGALATSIGAGPAGVISVGAAIILTASWNFVKSRITGSYEIGDSGIMGNGLIFEDSQIDAFSHETDNKNGMIDLHSFEDNSHIEVDEDTAYAILAEDWKSYLANGTYYSEHQQQAIDAYFEAMANNNGKRPRQEIWDELIENFGPADPVGLDISTFTIDLLSLGLTYP